jgi:hypothetical protein
MRVQGKRGELGSLCFMCCHRVTEIHCLCSKFNSTDSEVPVYGRKVIKLLF